jgi:hypothetical protein
MPPQQRCAHCGATRNAYVWCGERMIRVKLVAVRDRGGTLMLCTTCDNARIVEKRGDEGTQLRLFE